MAFGIGLEQSACALMLLLGQAARLQRQPGAWRNETNAGADHRATIRRQYRDRRDGGLVERHVQPDFTFVRANRSCDERRVASGFKLENEAGVRQTIDDKFLKGMPEFAAGEIQLKAVQSAPLSKCQQSRQRASSIEGR